METAGKSQQWFIATAQKSEKFDPACKSYVFEQEQQCEQKLVHA